MSSIRKIQSRDAETVSRLAGQLNDHFGLETKSLDAGTLADLLSGERPFLFGFLSESAGFPVGYALCQDFFDTDTGTMGTWLLDLYVREPHRNSGVGGELLRAVARDAVNKGRVLVSLAAYRDNPARNLYARIGAEMPDEAILFELRDDKLAAFARAK